MSTHFSLQGLVLRGVLGAARAGMTRGEIHAVLGSPDEWGVPGPTVVGPANAGIWRYGVFEVHFADDDRAWLLFTDSLHRPLAGAGRTLDPWILSGSAGRWTLAAVIAGLHRSGATYERGWHVGGSYVVRVDGGADLAFDGDDNGARWEAVSALAPGYARPLAPTRPRADAR